MGALITRMSISILLVHQEAIYAPTTIQGAAYCLISSSLPTSALLFSLPQAASTMSPTCHVTVTAASPSSNFQLIFDAALKAYEKKTKRDLLAHPLASQLQTCDTLGSILTVLQSQVDDVDQARRSDERLTRWLSPTVNVILAFSDALCEGVSLVCLKGIFWDYSLRLII